MKQCIIHPAKQHQMFKGGSALIIFSSFLFSGSIGVALHGSLFKITLIYHRDYLHIYC